MICNCKPIWLTRRTYSDTNPKHIVKSKLAIAPTRNKTNTPTKPKREPEMQNIQMDESNIDPTAYKA